VEGGGGKKKKKKKNHNSWVKGARRSFWIYEENSEPEERQFKQFRVNAMSWYNLLMASLPPFHPTSLTVSSH
jgi:antibiotic biosynthesis monooxygenase (ABM) superfamily enzyme